MTFTVDQPIFEKFPSLTVGVVVAQGINNTAPSPDAGELLREQVQRIRASYQLETLKGLPNLHAWREAYTAFGAKPKKYTCSVENLYRMILEGVELKPINTLVDLYNVISLKHMVPVGGDDLDRIDGDITLRFATGEEPFIRLNADAVDHPKPGEVIYADDVEVLCRRWNWRECDKSKMTKQTTNALLVVEGLAPCTEADTQMIVAELAQLVREHCGGTVTAHVLSSQTPSLVL